MNKNSVSFKKSTKNTFYTDFFSNKTFYIDKKWKIEPTKVGPIGKEV